MGTRIHLSGLSYFLSEDSLRQAFIPFGTVERAKVLRDEWGHSLGLGIVHMAHSEDVERVFNEHQRLEISGSHVDIWEPAEPEETRAERIVVYAPRDTSEVQTGQNTGYEKSQKPLRPLAMVWRRLVRPLTHSSRTAKH